jgi:competence protein ComEA
MFILTRQEKIIVFFLIGVSIVGLGVLYYRKVALSPARQKVVDGESLSLGEPEVVCVDVSGAVWRPGVYKLESGARVGDVLTRAVLRPDADVDAVNRAVLLFDGQKIVVPVKGSKPKKSSFALTGKVNINTATEDELCRLPHIGEVRSRDIVDYRNTHGSFAAVEELKKVPGIGNETLRRLRDLVVVE